MFFLRDTLFLLIGQVTLLYATLVRGIIDMVTSVAFVGMYVLYVVVVFVQEKYYDKQTLNAEQVMFEMKKVSSNKVRANDE